MNSGGDKGRTWAQEIQAGGWQQCSVFRPPADSLGVLPPYLDLQQSEWLVVCTQSCSLCSDNFSKEPLVEVLVASPLPRFNAGHNDAKGRNNHTLHLPISGLPGAQAISCQIGRRAFIPRHLLREWMPAKAWVSQEAVDSFKGWLANYYMRIALPDELVARFRAPGGISETLRAALLQEIDGRKADEGVSSLWISWTPDEDLPRERLYGVSLVVVCDDDGIRELLDRELSDLQGRPSAPISIAGVIVQDLTIDLADNVSIERLSGMSRFNEWDDLSSLRERLGSMRSAV